MLSADKRTAPDRVVGRRGKTPSSATGPEHTPAQGPHPRQTDGSGSVVSEVGATKVVTSIGSSGSCIVAVGGLQPTFNASVAPVATHKAPIATRRVASICRQKNGARPMVGRRTSYHLQSQVRPNTYTIHGPELASTAGQTPRHTPGSGSPVSVTGATKALTSSGSAVSCIVATRTFR